MDLSEEQRPLALRPWCPSLLSQILFCVCLECEEQRHAVGLNNRHVRYSAVSYITKYDY